MVQVSALSVVFFVVFLLCLHGLFFCLFFVVVFCGALAEGMVQVSGGFFVCVFLLC